MYRIYSAKRDVRSTISCRDGQCLSEALTGYNVYSFSLIFRLKLPGLQPIIAATHAINLFNTECT